MCECGVNLRVTNFGMTEKHKNKIKVCQNKIERNILGLTWKDTKTLTEIKTITGIADAIQTIKSLKLSWTGHLIRKEKVWTGEVTVTSTK